MADPLIVSGSAARSEDWTSLFDSLGDLTHEMIDKTHSKGYFGLQFHGMPQALDRLTCPGATSKFGMPNSFRQRELSILVQIQPTAMVLHDNLA